MKLSIHCDEGSNNIEICISLKQSTNTACNLDLFTWSHLLTAQKPASKCYVTEWFIRAIVQ